MRALRTDQVAVVAGIDAVVFVTPEYNYGSPPALVNALDHLYVEWNYKAAAIMLNEFVRWTEALKALR